MDTLYDMLDDASKDVLFEAWESLSAAVRAGSALSRALASSGLYAATPQAGLPRLDAALGARACVRALARDAASGGDEGFYEELAGARLGGPGDGLPALLAREAAREADEAASGVREAARLAASELDEARLELVGLADLAGDTVHAGEV